MTSNKIYNNAIEIAKFVSMPDETKLDILIKYGLIADVVYGGEGYYLIQKNIETFRPLMSPNVIKWVMTEKNKPIYTKAIQLSPKLGQIFVSESNANTVIAKVSKDIAVSIDDVSTYDNIVNGLKLFGIDDADDISEDELELNRAVDELNIDFDFDDTGMYEEESEDDLDIDEGMTFTDEDLETEEGKTQEKVVEKQESIDGYIEKIHGGHRRQIETLFLSAWEDLYGKYADGQEIVNGLIVPGGAILGTGETIKYEGVLTLNERKIEVTPNTMSNAIFEEFIGACKDCGISMVQAVAEKENEVKPFKYNPMLQRKIASGDINKTAFQGGWKSYENSLKPFINNITKQLAVKRVETGSDTETYNTLSGYTISLMAINYKDELGTQLRVCCGDTSKTSQVANRLVSRLREREKTHRSLAQGKLIVSRPILSDSGMSSTISIYLNMAGYQAVPQFMGELLCNLNEGMFKPSLDKMIIGVDMQNNIVTAPFTKWLLPIIAGSRSGKGVLTLNMLLNVIGGGTPLFYLDGKPDMAALLWKLQDRYNIPKSMVIDGIGYEGVTDVDRKPYRAPYVDNIKASLQSPNADPILETNQGVMIYLKTMLVILLSLTYYKEHMDNCYGDMFVVFDEMYKVMKAQVETLAMNIDTEIAKLDKTEKERKNELNNIKMWITELLRDYIGKDIGVFAGGIKAVALTQFAQVTQYEVAGFGIAKTFCQNFLLKRGVKLFGRQEGGAGMYGVVRDKNDEINFDLYNKYFHFGIGSETGNTYNNIKTFKPLLVLNENDCMERTGDSKDGAFTRDMMGRVATYTDSEQFREKYFRGAEDIATSIGFEGALEQVGRLIGANWQDMLRNSLERSYEISEKALEYYGVIGVEGINNVYDFICSFETKHLWSYNEITTAKAKGKPLGDGNTGEFSDEEGDLEGESVFKDTASSVFNTGDDADDIILDFGNVPVEAKDSNYDVFGGKKVTLSKEEKDILDNMKKRIDTEEKVEDEEIREEEIREEELEGEDTYTEEEFIDPVPEEEFNSYETPAFEVKGKKIHVKPDEKTHTIKLTPENSIEVTLDEKSPLEKFEKSAFKTLRGSNYEFDKRWKAILNSVSRRINPDLVTRVMIVQDELYINGRYVSMQNILGGFANIRLEDLVDYKALFKKFKNITELVIDTTMVERFQIEQPNLPSGFFVYSQKLIKVGILLPNGTKEVIDRRNEAVSEKAKSTIDDIKKRNQFESVCAAKNPRFKDKSPGYQSKVWNSTKSFGGKGWDAMTHQLSKQNPSFIKAAGIGLITTGVMAVGGLAYGVGKIFDMFKR